MINQMQIVCGSKLSVHLKVDVVWKADREISG